MKSSAFIRDREPYLYVVLTIFLLVGKGFALSLNDRVDTYIKKEMVKYKIPGLTIAVAEKGKILKLRGYGVASVEFDLPTNENAVYQLFSVSKIFAGVAAMKLVEDNKLSLDTPVTDIIDNLPPDWKAIHIRHLLTHTSGLQEMAANPRFACLAEDKKKQISAEEEVEFIAELPLKFQPGEKFFYHQSGYRLLGMIIEKVTKRSYAEFLNERVFAPLGMNATQFGGTEAAVIKRRATTSYSREAGELRGWLYPFTARDYPAAGLNSSAIDLAKFFVGLDSSRVLRPASLQTMWSPVRLNNGTEKGYGLGWTIDNHKGREVVGHEGGGAIWVAYFPNDHLAVVVLCNLNGARADEIQYGIADFYLERK